MNGVNSNYKGELFLAHLWLQMVISEAQEREIFVLKKSQREAERERERARERQVRLITEAEILIITLAIDPRAIIMNLESRKNKHKAVNITVYS